MALSTLAEWTGSAIISNLVDTAYSYLAERMLPDDIESDLNRLSVALPKIKAVMAVAELLKWKHPISGVDAWIQRFRLAFQAAEDVLDEMKYRELEIMVKNRDQASGSSSSTVGSLKRKFPMFSGSTTNDDTSARLHGAVKQLDLAAADIGSFFQLATALSVCGPFELPHAAGKISNRETSSFLTESNVFGREAEKARIVEWLKKPASHGHISVFCIVGVGGLGKTTLAQSIFQKVSRENHFDRTIWVFVSTSFSVLDITKKILEELGEGTGVGESLNGLQRKLKEKILSKKVLFILDDVWNDDKMCDWEKLMAPFKCVQHECKILITTRMKSVADMVARVLNAEQEDLILGGLEEQELLLLFNKNAFHGFNPDNHKDLQIVGNKIVKMLRGSPLIAKVIGSLLNSCMNFHFWKKIGNSGTLINLEQAKDVVDVLKLSYYHLPSHLQECFRFCCIFPQDYLFEKNKLIRMWMAVGFLRQQSYSRERAEDIGEEYFKNLLRKSFFERCMNEKWYRIHDLMYDLAKNVSNGECCRVEPNDKLVAIPRTVQHVFVHESEIERIFDLVNLRTLVIEMSSKKMSRDLDRFIVPNSSLKKTLRLLSICGNRSCEIPEGIGNLMHLRYLFIQSDQSFKYWLPHSTFKLHHLQVLELPRSWDGAYLSAAQTIGITNLVSLRYLNLPNKMMQNIYEVHKLTPLQELNFFVGQESGYHIDELRTLNDLQLLSIKKIENARDPAEANNANLSKKEGLVSLSLNWTPLSNSENLEQIIDNLQPHPNLKELTIEYYKGNRSPIWLSNLPPLDLSTLQLYNCPMWEDLPFLGQMPHLKYLELVKMNEVKQVHYSDGITRSACAFPSLEKLHCQEIPKWESWAGSHSNYGFPNLKELFIKDCPNLAKLPVMPLSLYKFQLYNVGLNSLPDIYHSSGITAPAPSSLKSSLSEVRISNCSNLKSLDGFLQQENLDLHAIELLSITDCENLIHLPFGAFKKFLLLQHLSITRSPKLAAVDDQSILLPVKIQSLLMGGCGDLDVPLLESASRLTIFNVLDIEYSANITRIPSTKYAFGSLSKLTIGRCDKLVEFSTIEQAQGINQGNNLAGPHSCFCFPNLKELRILHCPNLAKLPSMPHSLLRFELGIVGLNSLPDIYQSSSSTAPAPSSLKSSVIEVQIFKCSNIRTLNGFLQQENLDLHAFERLSIVGCENLIQLPLGTFEKFVSLKYLSIMGSPKLVVVDNQNILLPENLLSLSMGNCGDLDVPLLEAASRLTTLTKLSIGHSAITCIPSSENAFGSLSNLSIRGCDMLVEPSFMEQAHGLNPGNNLASLKISDLSIDRLSLLLIEPLRSLRSVSICQVKHCSGMEALPEQWLLQNSSTLKDLEIEDASSLRSLPGTVVRLTSLQFLYIHKAPLLEEIPEMPTSLINKKISGSGGRLL